MNISKIIFVFLVCLVLFSSVPPSASSWSFFWLLCLVVITYWLPLYENTFSSWLIFLLGKRQLTIFSSVPSSADSLLLGIIVSCRRLFQFAQPLLHLRLETRIFCDEPGEPSWNRLKGEICKKKQFQNIKADSHKTQRTVNPKIGNFLFPSRNPTICSRSQSYKDFTA